MNHRFPASMHSQTEAVFHSVRSIGKSKMDTDQGIRSFGSWEVYKGESHRFTEFMHKKGRTTILDTLSVRDDLAEYLEERLAHYARLNTEQLRMEFYARSRKLLRKSSKLFDNRVYPDPVRLISAINDGTFQLQASLQYEGGLRAEGVGAPSNRRLKNPLTSDGLRGIATDPVTGMPVGSVASVEKGGKETKHYVSVATYRRLEEHISRHGKLESDYFAYVEAINTAAKATGQYSSGRGSHGLKHNFAQERYLECIKHGMSHERALQQTSLETSHFRLRETLTYTRG